MIGPNEVAARAEQKEDDKDHVVECFAPVVPRARETQLRRDEIRQRDTEHLARERAEPHGAENARTMRQHHR